MKDTVAISFDIGGLLRFLSHQETAALMARALVRARAPLLWSCGFNPRPRMSLPLPRSVGVAAQGDCLCFDIDSSSQFDHDALRDGLQAQLPDGIRLGEIERVAGGTRFYPDSAEYVFVLRQGGMSGAVQEKVAMLAGSQPCTVRRRDYKKGTTRTVDARQYILSARAEGREIRVRCGITPAGTLRVDELMTLLEIDFGMLDSGVLRRGATWHRRR